jgi:hypothetical protein
VQICISSERSNQMHRLLAPRLLSETTNRHLMHSLVLAQSRRKKTSCPLRASHIFDDIAKVSHSSVWDQRPGEPGSASTSIRAIGATVKDMQSNLAHSTGCFHIRWIACTSARLHIQKLQRIDPVNKLRISSLQASHYQPAARTPFVLR